MVTQDHRRVAPGWRQPGDEETGEPGVAAPRPPPPPPRGGAATAADEPAPVGTHVPGALVLLTRLGR
ncbi:hypothetical protein I6A84_19125, partial [Frankia sp. CNm7]|nr:hypothetical protein [Frankia nepalensis]